MILWKKVESLLDYMNLFCTYEYENNDENKMKKISCGIPDKYRKIKNPKTSYTFETKKWFFLLFVVSARMKTKK